MGREYLPRRKKSSYCEEYTCTFMKPFLVNNCLVSN